MDNFSLTRNDYELIEKIIIITKKIYKVYMELYNYEIKGEKNSKEYNQEIKYLLALIKKEHILYSKLNVDEQKCSNIFSYIFDKKFINIDEDDNILFQGENVNLLIRIFCNLSSTCLMNFSYNDMSDFALVLAKGTTLDELQINDVVKSFQKDLFIKTMSIIDEYIKNTKYQNIKKILLNSKYLLSFGNRDIEVEMLENNFEIIKPTMFYSSWLTNLYGIDSIDYYRIRDAFGVIEYSKQLNYLLEIKTNQLRYRSILAIYIMRQSILRASLLFMGNKTIKDTKHNLYDDIEDYEFLKESFDGVESDRKKFNL